MSRIILLSLLLSTVSVALCCGQVKPSWISASIREVSFPASAFFTGYAQGNVRADETVEDAKLRLLRDAQGLLTESIRMTVRSHTATQTVSTRTDRSERIDAVVAANVETTVNAEIVGMNSETPYHDAETGVIHAFAWVNRVELSNYHRANILMYLTQAEGLLQTASDLEASGEKARARQQCQAAIPLLERAREAQNWLVAIDANTTAEAMQQQRTEAIHNRIVQMTARLAQAVYVHIESVENNFSQTSAVIANRLKAELSAMGCSFTDEPEKADFRMKINATTRFHGVEHGFSVCYADVAVNLFDVRRNISVFQDEFSQKGIHSSRELAGKKALEDAAPAIANKTSTWFNN